MYSPLKREPYHVTNEMAIQSPPQSFSKELRKVLQERNLLTAKSRQKVCSMLNDSRSSNSEVDKRRNFRLQAIEEIVASERTYLGQLEMLMEFFVRPLKEQTIINDASHTALFGQIEMIHNLNGELLRELEGEREDVAGAFLKMAPFFKLYSVYAFDYRNALLILQDLTSKNPVFRKFLQRVESRPEVQRKLNSLMIVPIQRVPRYKLLLEQVLLYTSPADADFKSLKESIREIERTVLHINSCIEDQEVTQMLINLQNSLVNRSPNIVKPSRKVIKEGVLQKITRNGTGIRRYCVLMSDIFMYCKILKDRASNTAVENSLECCCIFPLKKCKVYELFPGNFKITCQTDGIILSTTDLQMARAWVGFMRDAIDLHIQCRKTLRKESSKRKPIRKKDLKNFGLDSVLSPSKKKCEYETIFRNRNQTSDSEDEVENNVFDLGCFGRKRTNKTTMPMSVATVRPTPILNNQSKNGSELTRPLKRPAPPPPPPPSSLSSPSTFSPYNDTDVDDAESDEPTDAATANCVAKLYKLIVKEKSNTNGTFKRTATGTSISSSNSNSDYDPTYGFANRYSDSKSYFRAHNVDNTIPTAIKREDLFGSELGDGNFRDVLFPLRSSGGSNKSSTTWSLPYNTEKENKTTYSPPQRKRVKFEDTSNATYNVAVKQQPFVFSSNAIVKPSTSLREKIYDFFANLF